MSFRLNWSISIMWHCATSTPPPTPHRCTFCLTFRALPPEHFSSFSLSHGPWLLLLSLWHISPETSRTTSDCFLSLCCCHSISCPFCAASNTVQPWRHSSQSADSSQPFSRASRPTHTFSSELCNVQKRQLKTHSAFSHNPSPYLCKQLLHPSYASGRRPIAIWFAVCPFNSDWLNELLEKCFQNPVTSYCYHFSPSHVYS